MRPTSRTMPIVHMKSFWLTATQSRSTFLFLPASPGPARSQVCCLISCRERAIVSCRALLCLLEVLEAAAAVVVGGGIGIGDLKRPSPWISPKHFALLVIVYDLNFVAGLPCIFLSFLRRTDALWWSRMYNTVKKIQSWPLGNWHVSTGRPMHESWEKIVFGVLDLGLILCLGLGLSQVGESWTVSNQYSATQLYVRASNMYILSITYTQLYVHLIYRLSLTCGPTKLSVIGAWRAWDAVLVAGYQGLKWSWLLTPKNILTRYCTVRTLGRKLW